MSKKAMSLLLIIVFMLSLFATAGFAKDQENREHQGMFIEKKGVFAKEAKGNPNLTDDEKKKRRRWLEDSISNMIKERKTQKEIDTYLAKNGVEVVPLEASPTSDGDIGILSDKSTAITMYDAYAYYDSILQEYIVQGRMKWNRKSDYNSTPYWYDDITNEGAVGGYEGVGLQVDYNENTYLEDYSLISYDVDGNSYRHTTADDWDTHVGVTYKVQDYAQYAYVGPNTWKNWDYTFDSYRIYTYWTLSGPIGTLGIKHKYGHTWSSTSVDSTSISWPAGVTFTFSSSSNRWDATSGPAYWTFN